MKKSLINKIIVLSVIIVAILALDLTTKYVFDAMFEEGTGKSLGIFNLIIVHNHGAAWGIFSGNQVGLVILSLVFLGIFIWFYVVDKKKSWLLTITFAFLCAGCIGNLFDRLVFGYVRDFIQFAFWQSFPVFNFADVFLTFGVVLFAVYLIIYACKKEKKAEVVDAVGKIMIEEAENESEAEKDNLENGKNMKNKAKNSSKNNEFKARSGKNSQSETFEDNNNVKTEDKNE